MDFLARIFCADNEDMRSLFIDFIRAGKFDKQKLDSTVVSVCVGGVCYLLKL